MKTLKQVESIDAICEEQFKDLPITEAEYQGKKVKLNDPVRGGSKKFYVYVKDGDKVKKYHLVIQLDCQLKEIILQEENPFVQDIIVITQDLKQKQDIGLVINGVQTHQSIINFMLYEKSNTGT